MVKSLFLWKIKFGCSWELQTKNIALLWILLTVWIQTNNSNKNDKKLLGFRRLFIAQETKNKVDKLSSVWKSQEPNLFLLLQTFCVVSRRFNKNYVQRFSATRAMFIFQPWNIFRCIAIYLSTNQVLILTQLIAANPFIFYI